MAEHRGHNEGSIYERKNKAGEVIGYRCQITVPGGRRSQTLKTEREARQWLRKAQAEAAQGRLGAKRPPTLADYLSEWLKDIETTVKSRTVASYALNVTRVPAWLQPVRLDELRPSHFQRFYRELTSAGLAPRTVRQVHMTMHTSMEDALRLDRVNRNPTDGVTLPRIPQKEMQWYGEEQLARLLDTTGGDRFHALWAVLSKLGLRLGEALGMKWEDIDWRRSTITIQRSLHRNRLLGALELQEPKTPGSRRTLTLPSQTVAALQAHRDRQDFERRKARSDWQEHGLIFTTTLGTPLDQGRIHHNWTIATKKAGLPRYRVHDLRHSVASILIANGMGLLEVAHLLGHSDGGMVTKVYGHIAPDDHRRAAAMMERLFDSQQSTAHGVLVGTE
jgi:integrase